MKKLLKFSIFVWLFLKVVDLSAAAATPQDRGLSNAPGVDITVQSLFAALAGLVCWATRFIMVIMVLMIVWYGFRMMAAQGNDTKFNNAKKSLGYAVIGILVIMGAYTIIATVGNTVESVGRGELAGRSAKYTMFVPISCGGY